MASRKRFLCFLVLQIMLATQVIMAQHLTVHFMEEGYAGVSHTQSHGHGQHNHPHGSDKFESIHSLYSDLTQALSFAAPDIPAPVAAEAENVVVSVYVLSRDCLYPYSARAPPVFS